MSPRWQQFRFARDHAWVPRQLSAYLDSELPARARARLERHTAACPDCDGVLDSLRFMLSRLHHASEPTMSAEVPDITGAVLQRMHESADG